MNNKIKEEDRAAQIQQLEKPLGPEYVSFKNGHAYIEGHKVVKLANEVFGFDGWSSEIRNMTIDYTDERNGRYTVGVSCTMRILLKNGVFREDIGYGSSINMPHKFQAYDKARKEAATDALKRALRQFGETLGNCLYNRDYVDMVKRMKPDKVTFDEEDMRRPKKKIKTEQLPAISMATSTYHQQPPPTLPRAPQCPPQNIPAKPVYPQILNGIDEDDEDDDEDERDELTALPNAAPRHPQAADHEASQREAIDRARIEELEDILSNDEPAVFVTADNAELVRSPNNQSTPLPPTALFDVSSSSLKNSKLPQDRSMRIPRRPKT